MTHFDKNRRAILQKGIATAGLLATTGIPSIALGNPIIVGSLVGAIASSVFSAIGMLVANNRQAKESFELEKQRLVLKRIDYYFDQLPVTEQLAMVRDGSYYRALLTGNLDGFGSQLGVIDGQIILARGGTGGQIHSDMVSSIITTKEEVGHFPVPVTNTPAPEYSNLNRGYEFIADKMGMSLKEYKQQFPAQEVTTMSFARDPKKGGEDFAFLTSLNMNQTRQANGRMEAAVTVNPIPRKLLA